MMFPWRRKCCGLSCRRLPFLITAIILTMMNVWLWCNVFSVDCRLTQPLSILKPSSLAAAARPTVPSPMTKVANKNVSNRRSLDMNYSEFINIIDETKKSLHNSLQMPEGDLNSLNVPTISPSDMTELKAKILKMSNLKREFEIDEMMKQIEKNEHNLKRVNISISLSKENNANFEKKAVEINASLDELVRQATEMEQDDDSKIHLKIQKLLDDLNKIDERMKKYKKLLEKQKDLMITNLALHHNLTFFESVVHT